METHSLMRRYLVTINYEKKLSRFHDIYQLIHFLKKVKIPFGIIWTQKSRSVYKDTLP